jgi:cell division protein FtsZ
MSELIQQSGLTTGARLDADADPVRKPLSIKVLGVGGAGCSAVRHLARDTFPGLSLAWLNTDAAALGDAPVETQLQLGSKSLRGLGSGGDPERGRAAAEEDVTLIRALCDGADVVFIVAGLGGGTGTGASPVVARVAKETGALVLGLVLLPFECEGGRRQRQAQWGLQELKTVADGVICLPNQRILKLIDEKTSLVEAFRITNDFVAEGVRAIWRLLSRPGLIKVDFADLCAVVRGRHGESSLATVEARGENRAREAVEKLLAHPLLEGGQALTEASAVLVSITGGPELTLAEVNWLMEQISRHSEQGHIIMGAGIEPELQDRLMVTLVASRRGGRGEDHTGAGASSRHGAPEGAASAGADLERHLVDPAASSRPPSRIVPPPPELTPEKAEQLLAQQNGGHGRARKSAAKMRQGQLPLEIVSKGRFEKSEPTLHEGQDLDVPTYIRKGVALN